MSLEKLQYLHLSNNKIEKIEGLETLKILKHLGLDYNLIESLEGLEQLKSLESLHIRDNRLPVRDNFVWKTDILPYLGHLKHFQEFNSIDFKTNEKFYRSYRQPEGYINIGKNDNSYPKGRNPSNCRYPYD